MKCGTKTNENTTKNRSPKQIACIRMYIRDMHALREEQRTTRMYARSQIAFLGELTVRSRGPKLPPTSNTKGHGKGPNRTVGLHVTEIRGEMVHPWWWVYR